MKFVIFGLTMSSSWGNGHATIWRGLCRAMADRGHAVTFFERDVPYYAAHRDLAEFRGIRLVLYPEWPDVLRLAQSEVRDADVAMVTSYCPDAVSASELLLSSTAGLSVFYDMDTPVTLEHLRAGEDVAYIPPWGLGGFDLVLSYTGGKALAEMNERLGAARIAPLYGCADPLAYRPVPPDPACEAHLSYLGTYAADRQDKLDALFIEPARRMPDRRFVIGGSLYPPDFPWTRNIFYLHHVPPANHPSFYCSSTLTLNVTRGTMAAMGYCPSGRLFEAAACGVPVLSDSWEGLEEFFEPGREILVARTTPEAMEILERDDGEFREIARAARERALEEHTAKRRILALESILDAARSDAPVPADVPLLIP